MKKILTSSDLSVLATAWRHASGSMLSGAGYYTARVDLGLSEQAMVDSIARLKQAGAIAQMWRQSWMLLAKPARSLEANPER